MLPTGAIIARTRGKPIHYLANVSRWIWLLIGGGGLVFLAMAIALALLYPGTPANQLVSWTNGWMFLVPAAMAAFGVYMPAGGAVRSAGGRSTPRARYRSAARVAACGFATSSSSVGRPRRPASW